MLLLKSIALMQYYYTRVYNIYNTTQLLSIFVHIQVVEVFTETSQGNFIYMIHKADLNWRHSGCGGRDRKWAVLLTVPPAGHLQLKRCSGPPIKRFYLGRQEFGCGEVYNTGCLDNYTLKEANLCQFHTVLVIVASMALFYLGKCGWRCAAILSCT